MADLQQVPSKMCGCPDCLIDFPPEQHGHRPPQTDGCRGPWRLVFRTADRRWRSKTFPTLSGAHQFRAQLADGGRHAA
ncbi:hypothetical protein [Streptomyces sp. NPDC047315]|uniref:hypothetical protein n=1 Tax=Streptomyces sp. NPDC047315 TaxID=3155142 RepID=UPI0033F2CAE9